MLDDILDWAPATGPFFVFALLLTLPGFVFLWLAGTDSRWSLVLAPVVTTALVGVGATVLTTLGVAWSIGSFAAVSCVSGALLAAVRMVAQRCAFRLPTLRTLLPRSGLPWLAWGLVVNSLVVGWLYIRPSGGAENVSYEYDTVWHFSVIRRILDTGDAASSNVGLLDGTIGNHFYPAAWHALVALTAQATGSSISAAVQGSVLVVLLITWPLGLVWLHRILFGTSPVTAFAISSIAFLSAAYPVGFLAFGVLYPNFFSYALAPAALAVLIVTLRVVRRLGWGAWRRLDLAAVASLGAIPVALLFAQPNSAFTLLVILLPLVYVTIWQVFSPARRPSAPRWMRPLVLVVFSAVLVVGWIAVHDSAFLRRTVTVETWGPFQSARSALASWAFYGMYASWQVALGAVTIIGLALMVVLRRQAWWAVSWLLLGFLFVVATALEGGAGSVRNYLVGFWYADATRIAAAGAIVGLPAAAFALTVGARRLISAAQRRGRRGRATGAAVLSAVLVLALVTVTGAGPAADERAAKLRTQTSMGVEQWVSPDEQAFLARVGAEVPAGAVVANDPFDGSAMAYALAGVDVLFPAFPGNWMGLESEDQRLVARGLRDVRVDPAVCLAARNLGVRYAIVLDRGARPVFGDVPEMFSGLVITDATPGFSVVAREGDLSLFRLGACSEG